MAFPATTLIWPVEYRLFVFQLRPSPKRQVDLAEVAGRRAVEEVETLAERGRKAASRGSRPACRPAWPGRKGPLVDWLPGVCPPISICSVLVGTSVMFCIFTEATFGPGEYVPAKVTGPLKVPCPVT